MEYKNRSSVISEPIRCHFVEFSRARKRGRLTNRNRVGQWLHYGEDDVRNTLKTHKKKGKAIAYLALKKCKH